jgi:hypothetical protein
MIQRSSCVLMIDISVNQIMLGPYAHRFSWTSNIAIPSNCTQGTRSSEYLYVLGLNSGHPISWCVYFLLSCLSGRFSKLNFKLYRLQQSGHNLSSAHSWWFSLWEFRDFSLFHIQLHFQSVPSAFCEIECQSYIRRRGYVSTMDERAVWGNILIPGIEQLVHSAWEQFKLEMRFKCCTMSDGII